MGTTLENGVYLPSEGERNCYAGLKTNWEILDQKVADVTALQQAVAGALHRQIVASLPITDIDPNTIYMILSGTSATENVYNEYMYVNNAWELIGTSATDLTNYYTKAEVDGKLLLKANDSDVVHKSGDETIGGVKAFANNRMVVGRNTDNVSVVQFVNSDVVGDSANGTSGFEVYGSSVSDANKIGGVTVGEYSNNGGSYALIECNRTASGVKSSNVIRSLIRSDGTKELTTTVDNDCRLGSPFLRWSKIYGTEYYYGSNNVEFSTKFVTTDTAQTISGAKTFSDNLTIYNSDDTVTPKGLAIRNAQWTMGESGGTTVSSIKFLDKNSAIPASVIASKGLSGQSYLRFSVRTRDSQNTTYSEEIYYDIDTSGNVEFRSWHDNITSLGTPLYKWKDVQTNKINSLEPSSLSLPSGNASDVIDISSYLVNLDGTDNTYVAPANGWITIKASTATGISCTIPNLWSDSRIRTNTGGLKMLFPILKGQTVYISIYATTLEMARFIPCQGNV